MRAESSQKINNSRDRITRYLVRADKGRGNKRQRSGEDLHVSDCVKLLLSEVECRDSELGSLNVVCVCIMREVMACWLFERPCQSQRCERAREFLDWRQNR